MKEDIVTLETAKLANEKGFDWKSGKVSYDIMTHNIPVRRMLLQPTQSLLQKWLREKYNIHIWVEPVLVSASETTGTRFTWVIVYGRLDAKTDETPLGYLTYEEALEQGLKQALNLIQDLDAKQ